MKKASEIIRDTPPVEVARAGGKRQDLSTRYKANLLKKAEEIEKIVAKILDNNSHK